MTEMEKPTIAKLSDVATRSWMYWSRPSRCSSASVQGWYAVCQSPMLSGWTVFWLL